MDLLQKILNSISPQKCELHVAMLCRTTDDRKVYIPNKFLELTWGSPTQKKMQNEFKPKTQRSPIPLEEDYFSLHSFFFSLEKQFILPFRCSKLHQQPLMVIELTQKVYWAFIKNKRFSKAVLLIALPF